MSAPTPAEYVPLPALPPRETGELPQKKSDPLSGRERSTPSHTCFQVGAKPAAIPAALSVAQPSFFVFARPAAAGGAPVVLRLRGPGGGGGGGAAANAMAHGEEHVLVLPNRHHPVVRPLDVP